MTNIVKEYTIQGFERENSPDTCSCVVITKDTSRNPFFTIKVSDGQKYISLSASDPVLSEIAQAISDLTNGMFSPSRNQEVRSVMFSQELKDYEMSQLIQQDKITNIGEAIRKLNKEYFKIWMKMYYPNINPESLDDCYGYIFLAFWCGVDYANESHEKRDKEKETLSFFNKLK